MLNIKELEKQFDEILNSFTDQDLKDWLKFAEQREILEKLHRGEVITLQLNAYQVVTVFNESIENIAFEKSAGNYQYAMAA